MPVDPADFPVQDAKRRLRVSARAARAAAAAADRATGGPSAAALRDRFLSEVLAEIPLATETVVSAYWPLGDEIDPRALLAALAKRGQPLALPALLGAGQPLAFRAWAPGDPLQPAAFGTSEPLAQAPRRRPGLLLVPLLAFDAAGYRLGYGGGFYDRSLAQLRAAGDILAVGLAFAAQQVAAVPREATDQPLDHVVTEAALITPTRKL